MKAIEKIKELGKKRNGLLEIREDSWDEEFQDYAVVPNKEIDSLSIEIYNLLKTNCKDLPVDFIIEELTCLGYAPNLIYDDNGHFALTDSCFQSISIEIEEVEMFLLIPKKLWKNTIREAIESYFEDDEE